MEGQIFCLNGINSMWIFILTVLTSCNASPCNANSQDSSQFRHHDVCYTIVNSSLTWKAAKDNCTSSGKRIVNVLSEDVNKAIAAQMQERAISRIWLGGQSQMTDWIWISNEKPLYNKIGCFEDSRISGPRRELPNELYADNNNTPQRCINKAVQNNPQYNFAGTEYGRQCWGGNSETRKHIRKPAGECNTECTGNPKLKCGSNWRIMIYDVRDSYSNWKDGEPNSDTAQEWCAHLTTGDNYQWSDDDCTKSFKFICQLDCMPEESCKNNTSSYYYIDGTCMYVSNVSKSWYAARMDCVSKGGDLVLLDNPYSKMWDDVQEMYSFKGIFWIGATKRIWKWTNGEPFLYYAWTGGEPSSHNNECIVMNNGGLWDDIDCGSTAPFICQHELPPRTTTEESSSTEPLPTTQLATSQNDTDHMNQYQHDAKNIGMYAGIAVGGLILASIIIVLIVAILVKRKRNRLKRQDDVLETRMNMMSNSNFIEMRNITAESDNDDLIINKKKNKSCFNEKYISNVTEKKLEDIDEMMKDQPSPGSDAVYMYYDEISAPDVANVINYVNVTENDFYEDGFGGVEEMLHREDTENDEIMIENDLYDSGNISDHDICKT